MQVIRVLLGSLFTSFRDPTTHKFQRTLPLPPVTTVKGFLGAAMGKAPEEAINLPVEIGICTHKRPAICSADCTGNVTDLWKYDKYKSGKFDTKATVKRDILYRKDFALYFSSKDSILIDKIFSALADPKWALSLGRDDELVKILDVRKLELEACKVNEFSETVLPFDYKDLCGKPSEEVVKSFTSGKISCLEPPLVVSLPSDFAYDNKGVREVSNLKAFTFVGSMPIVFCNSVDGVVDNEYGKQIVFC